MARIDGMRFGIQVDDYKGESKGLHEGGEDSTIAVYKDSRQYGIGAEVKRRIMLGTYALSAGYADQYYYKAQKVRALLKKDFENALNEVDFLFGPTAPEVAFLFGAKTDDPMTMYLSDIYTVPVNLAGVPAISFPIGTVVIDGKNLPVGGHLIGKWFDEEGLLNAAYSYEQYGKK